MITDNKDSYLVYYRPPHTNSSEISVRKSLEEVGYLIRDPNADVHWVCKITKDRRKPKIEQLDLESIPKSIL